ATATMELPEHLLADTFRDLVINDLVDQLGLPMTRFLNSDRRGWPNCWPLLPPTNNLPRQSQNLFDWLETTRSSRRIR
ncbi:MAG: hypothetical protein AAF958_18795, partial [Planctomycetota bacterium]